MKDFLDKLKNNQKMQVSVICSVVGAMLVLTAAITIPVALHNRVTVEADAESATIMTEAVITESASATATESETVSVSEATTEPTTAETTTKSVNSALNNSVTSSNKVTTTVPTTKAPHEKYFHNKLSSEQNKQAYDVAKSIADSIPTDATTEEKVDSATKKVYAYFAKCTYSQEGPYYSQAYGVFIAGEASCAGTTRALGLVFDILGIPWEHMHPGEYTHQWCKVWIDGEIAWADAFIGYTGWGAHPNEK